MAFRAQLADFAAFYERSYPLAYRTALGICGDASLAADVTQEAFEAAYRQRDRFRGEVPADAWLLRIVVNRTISSLRRGGRVRWIEPLDPARHDRPAPERGEQAEAIAVREALLQLEPKQRAAILLRYYQDLDYASIARILDTSVSNVGVLLSRALDRLRRELTPDAHPIAIAEAGHGH